AIGTYGEAFAGSASYTLRASKWFPVQCPISTRQKPLPPRGGAHIPKVSRKPRSPAGVTVTARDSLLRRIQFSAKQRAASLAPSVPPICSRRSLQSRQGRQ